MGLRKQAFWGPPHRRSSGAGANSRPQRARRLDTEEGRFNRVQKRSAGSCKDSSVLVECRAQDRRVMGLLTSHV
jgi:hypothetical protein